MKRKTENSYLEKVDHWLMTVCFLKIQIINKKKETDVGLFFAGIVNQLDVLYQNVGNSSKTYTH